MRYLAGVGSHIKYRYLDLTPNERESIISKAFKRLTFIAILFAADVSLGALLTDFWKLRSLPRTTRQSSDFDDHGTVSGADFLRFQRGNGLTSQTIKAQGAANRDGRINGVDLNQLIGEFGSSGVPDAVRAGGSYSRRRHLRDHRIDQASLRVYSGCFSLMPFPTPIGVRRCPVTRMAASSGSRSGDLYGSKFGLARRKSPVEAQ